MKKMIRFIPAYVFFHIVHLNQLKATFVKLSLIKSRLFEGFMYLYSSNLLNGLAFFIIVKKTVFKNIRYKKGPFKMKGPIL